MEQGSQIRQFLRTSGLGRWGLAVTVLLVLLAVLAPWIAPRDPTAQILPARLLPPSAQNWMGTDELGRDVLSRTLYGARVSLLVGVSVVLGAGIVGLTLGSLAGYFGGAFDRFVNIILINSFLSFPGILLAIAFAAFLGPGLDKVILALTVTGWAGYARLARAQVLKVREMEFILAARSLGASHARILLHELPPNVFLPLLAFFLLGVAVTIVVEGALSFLGLGVPPPSPSWGSMIGEGRESLEIAPRLAFMPAVAMFLTVLSFNLVGDTLRALTDPRQGRL